MHTTFGQAKRILARHMGSNLMGDLGASVNTACEELSLTKNWRNMRKTVRLIVTNGYFALPQEYETVLRACVDGKPTTMHGTDIEYLLSGPGDFDYTEAGRAPVNGLQDLGTFATMYEPNAAMKLYFFAVTAPSGYVTVRGRDANGDMITETVVVNELASLSTLETTVPANYTGTATEFVDIERVVLPEDVNAYVSCYGGSSATEFDFLSRMHPTVKAPTFRRYRIPGFDSEDSEISYRILAEVRLRFLPLLNDDDVLPFESLLPVQYMLQSMWKMNTEDLKGADEFRIRAEGLLVRAEEVRQERAGVVVTNTVYDGSPGEASDRFDNI